MFQIVVDTNIMVAAMRSRRGASFQMLSSLGDGKWRPNLTVALVLEYEAVLKRNCHEFDLDETDIDDFVDAICSQAGLHRLYFRWRPSATDPDDDLVMEAAIASHSDFIITFNGRDFRDCGRFGIRCLTPIEFLTIMKEQP